jgi:hypothetical protein
VAADSRNTFPIVVRMGGKRFPLKEIWQCLAMFMQSETDWTRIELELLVVVRESFTKRLAA